jgi:hypothetical protein
MMPEGEDRIGQTQLRSYCTVPGPWPCAHLLVASATDPPEASNHRERPKAALVLVLAQVTIPVGAVRTIGWSL